MTCTEAAIEWLEWIENVQSAGPPTERFLWKIQFVLRQQIIL